MRGLGWQATAVGWLAVAALLGCSDQASAAPAYGPMPHISGPARWSGSASAFDTAPSVNAGFESGTFAGWTVLNEVGGSGDWFVYSGTISPLSGLPIAPPPQGMFAATSDQTGPGSHILFQDVTVPPSTPSTFSFVLYYENFASGFFSPPTLDFTAEPNQQYRVDIIKTSAPIGSVAAGDVLATVFQTHPGDPFSLGPTPMSFDLTPFAGQTVRIRFAEVDNQSNFLGSVDGLGGASAPVLGQRGLVGAVTLLLLLGTGMLLRQRRRSP
jgi:hypothetical protein